MPTILQAPIIDPAELADLRRRRLVNRSLLALALAVPLVAAGFVAFKFVSHGLASAWLRANHYRVIWELAPEERWKGGATLVKAGVHFNFLGTADPGGSLSYLTWLHRVKALDLAISSNLRDEDLAVLSRLTDLESLSLQRLNRGFRFYEAPSLSDAALTAIRPLTRLRELNLAGHDFTDEGLANLAKLDRLQTLDLRFTKVTDAAFERLKLLPALKSVDLSGTGVTDEGVNDFEAARPGVKVIADHLLMAPPKPKR